MKKFNIAIITTLTILVCVGIGILIWILLANRTFVQEITLKTNGTTYQELDYTAENLVPGGPAKEYELTVKCGETGDFNVNFSCESTGEGRLWEYLDIEILSGEESKKVPLSDLFEDGKGLNFEIALEKDVPMVFTIRYTMPLSVDSSAESARADFILLFNAERK